jgi:hypothetical protein
MFRSLRRLFRSNPNSERGIWCQLYDTGSGEPYNGSDPSIVYVSCDAVLYDLQEAILAKFCDSYLENFAPTDFRIYNTKAAFDKRNDAEAKTYPLPVNFVLSNRNLGASWKKALVVAVPSKARHSEMEVEAYRQGYLDAIALRLCHFYQYSRKQVKPTISDVLEAKDGTEGDDWQIHRALTDYRQILDDGYNRVYSTGDPLISIKLPDIFTVEEWEKLATYNGNISEDVYDETFIEEMITFLEDCNTKAYEIPNRDVLENVLTI